MGKEAEFSSDLLKELERACQSGETILPSDVAKKVGCTSDQVRGFLFRRPWLSGVDSLGLFEDFKTSLTTVGYKYGERRPLRGYKIA